MNNRVREIDFLRGLAVLLVVFFHYPSISYLNKVGYMGVDLFFVLSGYLISGLLFKEYLKFGDVHSGRFLIRRGFKIYPLFYLFIGITIACRIHYHEGIHLRDLLGELTFTRNYIGGFWAHTWTLCVEEHFYFSIAFVMLYIKKDHLHNVKKANRLFLVLLIAGTLLEFMNAVLEKTVGENYFFNDWARRAQTQYCFDSLLYGVFISYNLLFNKERLEGYFKKHVRWLTVLSVLVITLASMNHNLYFLAFRNTLLYLAFGNILLLFLTGTVRFSNIRSRPVNWFTLLFSSVGVYSYSIYLFHPFIRDYVMHRHPDWDGSRFSFTIYLCLSILIGVIFTKIIEFPMLKIRDKFFPARR